MSSPSAPAQQHPSTPAPRLRHQGPHIGALAIVWTVLFCAGLAPVTTFGGRPYFPGPWAPPSAFAAFFQTRPTAVLACAFFHFSAAIVLGIFTASAVNQMRFLGVRAAGVNIALFGGFATAFNIIAGSMVLWTLTHPIVSADAALTTALYFLDFGFGGVGFSVPYGLLMLGLSIPAGFLRLLPKWIVISGVALGAIGVLSTLDIAFPQALPLIPLTRFPGFLWLIAAGFALPRTTTAVRASLA